MRLSAIFCLFAIVRVLARPGSQMTLFEIMFVFLMGGIIILSTVGNDRSVTNCTCAAMSVGLLLRATAWVKPKSSRTGATLEGTPRTIIKNGEWQ
jgi:uncharacterized membrane protein YcaP (DUF421 family)